MTKLKSEGFYVRVMIGVSLIATGLLITLLLVNGVPSSTSKLSAIPVKVDFAAPELDLITLSGQPVSLSDARDDLVLVNLWATWCVPCREEMPALQSFYEKYEDHGLQLIAINQQETSGIIDPFVKNLGLNFPIWLDKNGAAQYAFHTAGLPSSYLIDHEGQVRLMWTGAISSQNLEKYLPPMIMGNSH